MPEMVRRKSCLARDYELAGNGQGSAESDVPLSCPSGVDVLPCLTALLAFPSCVPAHVSLRLGLPYFSLNSSLSHLLFPHRILSPLLLLLVCFGLTYFISSSFSSCLVRFFLFLFLLLSFVFISFALFIWFQSRVNSCVHLLQNSWIRVLAEIVGSPEGLLAACFHGPALSASLCFALFRYAFVWCPHGTSCGRGAEVILVTHTTSWLVFFLFFYLLPPLLPPPSPSPSLSFSLSLPLVSFFWHGTGVISRCVSSDITLR